MSSSCGKGRVELILGPMYSGKSTELMRRIRRYKVAGRTCVVINHKIDERYGKEVLSTHDRQMMPAKTCSSLEQVRESVAPYDCIAIDEGQFFADIVDFCEGMATQGKVVIVAALDGTYQRKPFGRVLELVPLSEDVCKLTAVCAMCADSAPFTRRTSSETEVEVIGGLDKYMAVCRACHSKNHAPK